MENYKKEKCSKQHLKIDLGPDQSQEDIFMLVNPMTYGDPTTPTSPPNYAQPSRVVSNPNTPTNSPHGGFVRSMERWSLKSRTKNQSIFKIFNRGPAGSASTSVACHKDEEDGGDGSSGSEAEDPFSPDLMHANRQMSEPPKSPPGAIEQYTTLPRQMRRQHSGGHSSRDSGFSSERESVSHMKDDGALTNSQTSNGDDVRVSPAELEEYRPAGMEALEVLHNQLQLLVKCDCDEETDSTGVYEQVIAHLSKQLEDQSLALDALKQSEANMRISLRLAEQRTLEAETDLLHTKERCLRAEKKYNNLASKYRSLRGQHSELEGSHKLPPTQRHHPHPKVIHRHSPRTSPSSGSSHQSHTPRISPQQSTETCRTPPQRVHSQTLYDRQNKLETQNSTPSRRPNTAQGFHAEEAEDSVATSITSLSHTETSV